MEYAKYNDYDWVFSYEHLYKAYKQSRKNVRWKASTQRYIDLAPLKLYKTFRKLKQLRYKSKGFFEFTIRERGKLRHIRSVLIDERVVQRCLCDYCLVPLLSRSFIYDNGASIKRKGYHFTRKRVIRFLKRHYAKYGTEGYVLIFDFSKFFDNISHALCKNIVRRYIADERIIKLVDHFIDMFGDIGLGLGSQISQILALASANRLDHIIKEELGIRDYARYMDDGVLISNDKNTLIKCRNAIIHTCKLYGIVINKKKTQIVKLSHGFTWIKTKFNILPRGKILKRLVRKNVIILRRKLKSFRNFVDSGRMTVSDVYMTVQSWRAYAKRFNAHRTIQRIYLLFYALFGLSVKQSRLEG